MLLIGILLDRPDEPLIEVWDELDVSEASFCDLFFVSSIFSSLFALSFEGGAPRPTLEVVDDTCEM